MASGEVQLIAFVRFHSRLLTAMLGDRKISANDVARSEERVRVCAESWQRFGCRSIGEKEWNEANANLSQCVRELRKNNSLEWRLAQLKFGLGWLVETGAATCVFGLGIFALLSGLVVFVIVLLAVGSHSAGPASAIFLVAGFFMAVVGGALRSSRVGQDVGNRRALLQARRKTIGVIGQRFTDWRRHIDQLRRIRGVQQAYEQAVQQHTRLVELLNSRRYRLVHCDWRSLRGTDFENFVAEVFEELGFIVEKTKVTGDQGVDLIVRGGGRTIAVQTKGYAQSVGNKAIQEVNAGKTYYRCTDCIAVTNSHFTSSAIDLAHSVGCRLIDGAGIPRLIRGEPL